MSAARHSAAAGGLAERAASSTGDRFRAGGGASSAQHRAPHDSRGGTSTTARAAARRKFERFAEQVHYIRGALESRRGAKKRVVRSEDLAWEDNLHGRNAYIIDSVTGVNSRNLAMFIREIPPGASTGSHRHNFEAVGYVLEGRGHDVHDGAAVAWKKGDGLYIPPLVEHRHFNDDPDRSAWLLFITNWPLLTHLGITTFVQSSEKRRGSTSSARGGRDGRARRR